MRFCSVPALIDTINWLGWSDPSFIPYVKDRSLHSERGLFGEQAQMLTAYDNFGPQSFLQHWSLPEPS